MFRIANHSPKSLVLPHSLYTKNYPPHIRHTRLALVSAPVPAQSCWQSLEGSLSHVPQLSYYVDISVWNTSHSRHIRRPLSLSRIRCHKFHISQAFRLPHRTVCTSKNYLSPQFHTHQVTFPSQSHSPSGIPDPPHVPHSSNTFPSQSHSPSGISVQPQS